MENVQPVPKVGFSRRASLSSGQPIGRLMAQALDFPDLISLAAGFVDNATLPCAATRRCMQQLGNDERLLRKALQYDTASGSHSFRTALVEWCYAQWPQARPDPGRVILTAGSNQFLHMLAETLIDPGDIVITAAPTYFVFLGTLRGVDARIIGVRADEDGMCMDSLEETLEGIVAAGDAHRVKMVYSVTEFDNPAGSSLSLDRRHRLLEIVANWRRQYSPLLILSDNAYQQVRFEGNELPPISALADDAGDFVIDLGTFSKSFSPGIRVGWGVVPNNMVERLLEIKSNMDFGSPHFSQVLMWQALTSGELEKHLPEIRDGYRVKRDAMLDALERELGNFEGVRWRKPHGGLYVWLTLPEHMDASEQGLLWKCATESGVLYVPGHYCYPSEGQPVARNTIRLSYGVQSAAGIDEGITRFAAAIREVAATHLPT
jgi:2-aminoadipate transaminase